MQACWLLATIKALSKSKQQILAHSGTMVRWVTDYIHVVSKCLSTIAAYQDKTIKLHPHANRELLLLLFAFNHQNYSSYLTSHQF